MIASADKKLLDNTLASLEFSLSGRDDFFLTTSFGYQSALLFFLLSELGLSPECLFVKSRLASAGVSRQMDYISSNFDIKLHIVCRDDWLEEKLFSRDFMDLVESERREICKLLKRDPLLEFIKKNSFKIWLSGIRKDQTASRSRLDFLEVTDLNVIKISPMFNWSRQQTSDLLASNNLRCNGDYYELCKVNESMECGLHL